MDKLELLKVLLQNYISEKENDKVWGRENSSVTILCMALDLELDESNEVLIIKKEKNVILERNLSSLYATALD